MRKESKPLVYLPADAKLNITNQPMEEIKTKYEKNRMVFDKEKVNKVVKGIYGSSDEHSSKLRS